MSVRTVGPLALLDLHESSESPLTVAGRPGHIGLMDQIGRFQWSKFSESLGNSLGLLRPLRLGQST